MKMQCQWSPSTNPIGWPFFFMDWQSLFSSSVLTFLLFIFMVLRLWRKKLESNSLAPNLPPGPWKLPFIGNLHQLVGPILHHRLADLAKKYGPIMHLQLGEVPTIVISSPEAAKQVMKTHEINFVDRPDLVLPKIAFYDRKDIVFAPYGDYWRQLRKVSVWELFGAKRVRLFNSVREEEVSNLIKSISSNEGLSVNLSKMFFNLINGILARTSIGKKCRNQEAFLPIIEELAEAGAGFNIADIFPSVKLFHMMSWTTFRLKRVHQEADEILETIITERRAKNTETQNGENELKDLLDVLLDLQTHGNFEFPITTENIKAIILEMFAAGSETTSTLVEWAMSEMVKDPKIMAKAQKEVREVFSDMGAVDETRLHELKFLKLVIKETMRLHPPVTLIPRACREGCKIEGYDIHAKTRVMINTWAIGRDPNYWNEPEKFQPERFLDSSIDYKGTNFELIPFGAGKRICPGILFGTHIVELTLAKVLYHFDWKLPNGAKNESLDMTEAFGGVTGRKHDLCLIPITYCPSCVG